MKQDHLLTPHTRINSKWIKDLNVRPETIKILDENIGSNISDIAHRNFLSDVFPQAKETRKNKQMGLHQTKKFLHSKGNHQQNKKPTEWENIFTDTSDKGLISQIYKELIKLNTKKSNNPIKKISKSPEHMLLQRGHTNGQQTYEIMLSITNHQRDAN